MRLEKGVQEWLLTRKQQLMEEIAKEQSLEGA